MKICIQKLFLIQLFLQNKFVFQGIQQIQCNKKFALTLLVIAYFLINYWIIEYSIMNTNSYSTKRLNSTDSTSAAGISFEIPSSYLHFLLRNTTREKYRLQEVAQNMKTENRTRCGEIKRRTSWGVVDYANWDGDIELQELLKPLFTKKRLVIWSLDHHPSPIYDIKSLIEPLGVEFIEHTVYPNCQRMCCCDDFNSLSPLHHNDLLWNFNFGTIDRIYKDTRAVSDIARADAFLVTYCLQLIELYMRYNQSIIAVTAIRYNLWLTDVSRWIQLSDRLRSLIPQRRHVIGANSVYDVEYMHYFLGVRPDYVPSFTGYTGEHYHPTRQSFLYAHRVFEDIGPYWQEQFERQYRKINAKFQIEKLRVRYKSGYDHSDLAAHLGIVHRPYQVHIYTVRKNVKCLIT